MNVLTGVGLSFVFVFAVIGLATLISKKGLLGSEGSRKLVHIGVANWYFIAVACFSAWWSAILVPLAFVALNYLSYRKKLFSAMERGAGLKDLGTVWYACSLALLSGWSFAIGMPWLGGIGILAMGWGDGLAAVVGPRHPKPPLPFAPSKSLAGTLTVFAATLTVSLFVFPLGLGMTAPAAVIVSSLACAVLGALLEAVTPLGFDNITLPVGVSGAAWLFVKVFA